MSRETRLEEVRVEGRREKRPKNNEFAYVNRAFVGSVNSVSGNVQRHTPAPVPQATEVYREQYCVCSRWPYTQRVLAIAVGVLLGALIGLILSVIIKDDDSVNLPIFNRSAAK